MASLISQNFILNECSKRKVGLDVHALPNMNVSFMTILQTVNYQQLYRVSVDIVRQGEL